MRQPYSKKAGFTLIELIIGITILALLAVGLLAALDPAEQFAKARDTGTRNAAIELHNALIRYHASFDNYPDELLTPAVGAAGYVIATTPAGPGPTIIQKLIDAGELKKTFSSAAGSSLSNIAVFLNPTGTQLSTCYRPTSKSFSQQGGLMDGYVVNNKINPTNYPTPMATCAPASQTGRDNCIYCAQ